MAKIFVNPQSGTLQHTHNLSISLKNIDKTGSIRVRAEDTTNNTKLLINGLQYYDIGNAKEASFDIDLALSPSFSGSIISIFVFIEEQQQDMSYKVVEICPAIYFVAIEESPFDGDIVVSPSYVSPKELCSIEIESKANVKYVISINDRKFIILTNDDGRGSFHFKASEILDKENLTAVERYPIFYYSKDDNYIEKKFTGNYLHVLPESIATYADIDPRCIADDYVPGEWTIPEECIEQPPPSIVEPIKPTHPATCLIGKCRGTDYGDNVPLSGGCRIHSQSAALLNNGMIIHAYLSVDGTITNSTNSAYNINKIYFLTNDSSIRYKIITQQDVNIEPKGAGENLEIHINKDLYDSFSTFSGIKVMLYDESIGYHCFDVLSKEIDEYTGKYSLVLDEGDLSFAIYDWLFCVPAVFYHSDELPYTAIDTSVCPSYVMDEDDNYLQTTNISICSNPYNIHGIIGSSEETYIYVVAEAIINNQNQLFYYSFSVGYENSKNSLPSTTDYSGSSFGWVQLTHDGNNTNPKISIDKNNTLHIVWESDRTGSKKIYYGALGSTAISLGAACLSSLLDKYAEFYEKDDKSVDYIEQQPLLFYDIDEYHVPEYNSQSLCDGTWTKYTSGTGSVTESGSSYLKDLEIYSNVINDASIAFIPVEIAGDFENPSDMNPSDNASHFVTQYNSEINFDWKSTIQQGSALMSGWDGKLVDTKEIDQIYNMWKTGFTLDFVEAINNVPVYLRNNNQYVLGRSDGIFDRIVPLVGSYAIDINNPSIDLEIMKINNNLKDFVLGLMLEKSVFKATNIQTLSEFSENYDAGEYVQEEIHTIFTGRAKLVVFIKNEDTRDDRSNYTIVREFPEVFDITDFNNFKILLNYRRIENEEVLNNLYLYEGNYDNRFAGIFTLAINNITKFSESFISYLPGDSVTFDFGFGIPNGGHYASDKGMPSELAIFDDVEITLNYNNIEITSPVSVFNSNIINITDNLIDLSVLSKQENDIQAPSSDCFHYVYNKDFLNLSLRGKEEILFYEYYFATKETYHLFEYEIAEEIDLLTIVINTYGLPDKVKIINSLDDAVISDLGSIGNYDFESYDVDISNYRNIKVEISSDYADTDYEVYIYFKQTHNNSSLWQIPISIEGISKSPDIDLGVCNDVHVAWQANKNKYWDIYTSNSVNKLKPFRYITQVTDTESNSIMPSISVNRNGKRMIVWHDNRNKDYGIYAARSINGYQCDNNACKMMMLKPYEDFITECNLSFDFVAESSGYYLFEINFYMDSDLNSLYKTISVSDREDGWFINGTEFGSLASYNNGDLIGFYMNQDDEITISYIPQKDDNIFDQVLNAVLVGETGG